MHDHTRQTAVAPRGEVILLHSGDGATVNTGVSPVMVDEVPLGACTRDPDRWTMTVDEGAKAICRACPRRWLCAQEACETPGAEGIWAGIFIPEAGRARRFALKKLRSLAEVNGFPVRNRSRAATGTGSSLAS